MSTRPSFPTLLLFAYMALFMLFITLPIAAVVVISFSSSSYIAFPMPGLSLKWYRHIIEYRPFVTSLTTSIELALASTLCGAVLAVPAAIDSGAPGAYSEPPSIDGSRPGIIRFNLHDTAEWPRWNLDTTLYHEGLPGHQLQMGLALQSTQIPILRRNMYLSAYGEGWALYAEQLGKEVGFYRDPVSDYGRLTSELFRAQRLVVDTGIHSKGWTRDQVVAFFREAGAIDEPTIQSETDRYIAWPAQALSYKLGQLKFRELRERAQRELGPKFDIRTFHDEMLSGGVLPLDLLEARTDRWIQAQKTAPTPAALH